jgi:general secretion pathway protein A
MAIYTRLSLEHEPFSTSPDPRFFYKSSEHCRALNRLEICIRLRRGMSLVLGDVGTGKTTLSRALFQAFNGEEDQYVFHMILDPSFKSEYQFLAHLTNLFGISPFFRSTIDHREAIEAYLFQKCVEQRKAVVLIIDEGQKLNQPQIEILRTLLNYETNEQKMLQLVILAQMELLPRVKRIHNFMDRVSFKYILNPLDEFETGQMIDFRLRQAGHQTEGGSPLFTPEAVHRIFEFTKGYPRQISRVCHNALEYLMMTGLPCVDEPVAESVIDQEKVWR